MESVTTWINDFDENKSLGIGLMTVVQIRSLSECFRACQHSEWLRLGVKTLDNSYGEEVQCRVTANMLFLAPFIEKGAIVKSSCNLLNMCYRILHISLGCKPMLVQLKQYKFPLFLMTHHFHYLKNTNNKDLANCFWLVSLMVCSLVKNLSDSFLARNSWCSRTNSSTDCITYNIIAIPALEQRNTV